MGSFGRVKKVTGDDRDVKGVVVVVVVDDVVDDVSVVADDVYALEDVAAALDDGDGGHGVASRSDHSDCSPCGET